MGDLIKTKSGKVFLRRPSMKEISSKKDIEEVGMGLDGMGYTVGTGVATAQKIVKRPTTFLPRLYYSNDSQSKVTQNPPLELFFSI